MHHGNRLKSEVQADMPRESTTGYSFLSLSSFPNLHAPTPANEILYLTFMQTFRAKGTYALLDDISLRPNGTKSLMRNEPVEMRPCFKDTISRPTMPSLPKTNIWGSSKTYCRTTTRNLSLGARRRTRLVAHKYIPPSSFFPHFPSPSSPHAKLISS